MGSDLQIMYTQLVEKLEYQNREAVAHDQALQKSVWKLQAEFENGLDKNAKLLSSMLLVQKTIIGIQLINFGANTDSLNVILKFLF